MQILNLGIRTRPIQTTTEYAVAIRGDLEPAKWNSAVLTNLTVNSQESNLKTENKKNKKMTTVILLSQFV